MVKTGDKFVLLFFSALFDMAVFFLRKGHA